MIFLSHPQTFCGFATVETVQNPTVDLATVRHSKRDTVVSRGGGGGGGEASSSYSSSSSSSSRTPKVDLATATVQHSKRDTIVTNAASESQPTCFFDRRPIA